MGRLGSLAMKKQPIQEKENSDFKPAILYLKINLVLHPAHGDVVGWIHTGMTRYSD